METVHLMAVLCLYPDILNPFCHVLSRSISFIWKIRSTLSHKHQCCYSIRKLCFILHLSENQLEKCKGDASSLSSSTQMATSWDLTLWDLWIWSRWNANDFPKVKGQLYGSYGGKSISKVVCEMRGEFVLSWMENENETGFWQVNQWKSIKRWTSS